MTGKKQVILTGDRPTGPLHLGHYVGSLQKRVELQNNYETFIVIADMQALTDHFDSPKTIQKNIIEVTLDYLATGINPEITTIFIQSLIPQLSELTMYYLNLVTVARLQRNPTVKEEMKQKEFKARIPAGFLMYPVSQAADITAFNANLVPVGEDQLPMIEQTAEIVDCFNNLYKCSVLTRPEALISETPRLPGLDGKTKMSKSLGNAIFLSDSTDTVRKKVRSMYTDSGHLRVEDPGEVKGNPVFSYLDAFDPDKKGVEKLKQHYRAGGLGDVAVKDRLFEIMENFLAPIRKRREELSKDRSEIINILRKGTQKAELVANNTLKRVRKAMGLVYF